MDNVTRSGKAIVVFLAIVLLTGAGCEPLRKKFIRKKKADVESNEAVAILDPIEYQEKVKPSIVIYQEHYNLWKVWHRDLETVVLEDLGDKKAASDLEQIRQHLTAMKNLLPVERQGAMAVNFGILEKFSQELAKPSALRRKSFLTSQLRALEKSIKNDFSPGKVQEALLSP